MLPDCIAHDAERTGRRQAGVFTGLWTAGETFGLALGPGIYGLVLQLSGYVSSDTGFGGGPPARAPPGHLRAGAPALRLRFFRPRLGGGPVRHGEAGRPSRLHADPGPADRPA